MTLSHKTRNPFFNKLYRYWEKVVLCPVRRAGSQIPPTGRRRSPPVSPGIILIPAREPLIC